MFCGKLYFVSFVYSLANEALKYNDTFELTDLDVLCDGSLAAANIDHHFNKSFVRFEVLKSRFSINTRCLWRQRFLHLAEHCKKRNGSREIISLAMKLADHAYKLPEGTHNKHLTVTGN